MAQLLVAHREWERDVRRDLGLRGEMKVSAYDMSRAHPRPIIDTWGDDHPFMRTFVRRRLEGDRLVMNPAFMDVIDFKNSERDAIVRLADVVVSLVRRGEIGTLNRDVYRLCCGSADTRDTDRP